MKFAKLCLELSRALLRKEVQITDILSRYEAAREFVIKGKAELLNRA